MLRLHQWLLDGRGLSAAWLAAVLWVLCGGASQVKAQCEPRWQPFDPSTAGVPGVEGEVHAVTMWDPDGPGPMTARLVVGGWFTVAGRVLANNIAVYDPATGEWSALGSGMSERVYALAVLPNGDLVAGGSFTTAGGVSVNRIARWNGLSWSALGSGVEGQSNTAVYALTVLPNGDLVAGGWFTSAGGVPANRIARWDGSSWSALGSGMNGSVRALLVLPNGDLVAGGGFVTAGGVPANYIARWNGLSWSALGSGMSGGVYALAVLPNGDLVAGGNFTTAGGVPANRVARWNGSSWSALGSGVEGQGQSSTNVFALAVLPNGDLVAGGRFTSAGGVPANNIARWNGSLWSAMGSGMYSVGPYSGSVVNALAMLPNGDLVAGGSFTTAGGVPVSNVARWDGSSWSAPLGSGMNGTVRALTVLPNGDLVAGGLFTSAGGVPANRVARWNGSSWSALGSGVSMEGLYFADVYALAVLPNGDLVAGGWFTSAGGVPANHIARWNGSSWSALGSGMSERVYALAVLPNGDLVAGGEFTIAGDLVARRIARWNGSSWSPMGTGMDSRVEALAVLPNGDLVAGGRFTSAGGVTANCIARWNGSSWSAFGSGMYIERPYEARVNALAVLPNGDLVAGGVFWTAGGVSVHHIARWNGSSWSALGSGLLEHVLSLAVLPNGDLVAGGWIWMIVGGMPVNNIVRWNGSSWSALGSGLNLIRGTPRGVYALNVLPNGDLLVGGGFEASGSVVAPFIARWGCVCPGRGSGACSQADWDENGVIDFNDLLAFFNTFNAQDPCADLNGDGSVDFNDFLAFMNLYTAGC